MSNFNKIVELSKSIAKSLLNDETPKTLEKSELFSQTDKDYIVDQLTNDEKIEERLQLVNTIDKDEEWKQLKSKINVPVRKLYWKFAAAASVLILITAGFWFTNKDASIEPQFTEPIIVNNQIETGTDGAILTLESGEEVTLEKGVAYQTQNATSNGEEIIYKDNASKEIAYNTLTVARGNQFFINLSDGTKVWLNSESQIKYPVSFIAGDTRQVDLIYGEVLFDVSPSTKHKGSKFKVYHNAQEVEVLGTVFNIKAYKDETNIYTTLVEGKVSVTVDPTTNNQQATSNILAPNQQSNLNLETNEVNITTVDVYNETAWRDGVFNFKRMSLNNIMKVLSRWYDMDIVFENEELKNVGFTGTFNKNRAIEDIMLTFKNTDFINDFEINNKTLIIK